jgi:hypothetical protein
MGIAITESTPHRAGKALKKGVIKRRRTLKKTVQVEPRAFHALYAKASKLLYISIKPNNTKSD